MIAPVGAKTLLEAMRWGTEIYHNPKLSIERFGTVGGRGFAPNLASNEGIR